MAEKEYPNSGSIKAVAQPKKSEKHPDYTGIGEIDGVTKFFISGWNKKRKADGKNFVSLSFKEMDEDQTNKYSGSDSQSSSGGNSDGLPPI